MASAAQAVMARWRRRLAINAAYRNLFGTPDGGVVLRDMAREAGLFSIAFDGDPHVTAFNEGKRAMVLFIMREIRWDDGDLMKLARERESEDPFAETTEG